MKRKEQKLNLLINLLKAVFVLIAGVTYYNIWEKYYQMQVYADVYYALGNYAMAAIYPALFLVFSKVYGGLQVGLARLTDIIFSNGIAVVFASVIMYFQVCLVTRRIITPWVFLSMSVFLIIVMALWAWVCNKVYFKLFPPKRTLILYENLEAYNTISKIAGLKENFTVTDSMPITEEEHLLITAMNNAEAVFVCGASADRRNFVLKYCTQNHIKIFLSPKITDIIISGSQRMHLLDAPLLYCDNQKSSLTRDFVKRSCDLIFATLMLILTSPIMLVVAVGIKLTDGGPVFFKQRRLTRGGKSFEVLKFRSMIVDAEKDGVARLATTNDDRITPIGKTIRKLRLDELPQLINIFKGEMSIVGPRPERPEIAAQYEQEMPEFNLRLQVKAGLTGYAQVYGKYNTTPYNKLQMDLMYIADNSLLLDLKLMLMTFKIMFVPESTEGVAEGQTVAGINVEEADEKKEK
ncbi:MAG: exopolysaccharide biosynthesis polyprenyl glycosylphosphotransferase [Oscillospiraceae bacterium]|nr:exopolysaccharide biosynthesis polyprenyl glycosylphosphotransferase [Oscillospiraceae bacterium]